MSGKKRQQTAVEDEEAFPRGGADDLTPLERRKLALQAEADFKHEQETAGADGQAPSKKKQKRGNDQDDEGAFFSKQAAGGKVAPHVQQLKPKSLHVGMKLLGCVLEVSNEQLTVSLPHGLRAIVPAAETSDLLHHVLDPASKRGAKLRAKLPGGVPPHLTQLFSVGQYVRCVIKDLGSSSSSGGSNAPAAADGSSSSSSSSDSKKRITATLRLKVLLSGVSAAAAAEAGGGYFEAGQIVPAVVSSIEDRGYSLSFGVKGVSGFLPSKDYATYYGAGSPPLLPGTLLDVAVTKAPVAGPGEAVVQVTVGHDAVSGGVLRQWDGLNMATLLPGMMVNVRIRQVARDGVHVSFCGFFSGTIDASHLGAPLSDTPWNKRYQVGQKVLARLLYVDTSSKTTGLSCLTHLINMRLPTAVPRMGQVFTGAKVTHVDGLGLLLRLPMEPEPAAAFAHISNLSDDKLSAAEVAKRFKVGSEVPCRVIGFRLVDGLVAVSCKQSVIEQQVYSVNDLYPGQPLEVTVLDTTAAGLVVSITKNLKGLVPKLHMTDSGGAAPKASKFKQSKKLAARVLSVDSSRKQVTLTLKKGLLGSKLPVLSDLRQAEPGMKLHGVVTGLQAFGVFVGFYGGVAGLIPNKDLDLLPGQQAADVYSVGQLMRVQVVSTDMRKNKLYLRPASKKSEDTPAAAAAAESPASKAAADEDWGGHAVGAVLSGRGVVQQVLQRPIQEGGGLVELLVTGVDGRQVLAHLPAAQLSDHPGGVEAILSVLRPGLTLPGPLLVLQHQRLSLDQHPALNRWQVGDDSADQGQGVVNGSGAQNPEESSEEGSDNEQQQQQKAGGGDALDVDGEQQQQQQEKLAVLVVSRKQSLLSAAAEGKLPSSAGEVSAGAVLPGYVASVTRDGVFVRFLGRCTGRAGLPQMADTFVTDPATHFNVGQSVMAAVLTVDEGSGRFSLSLKPSVAGHHAGAYMAAYASDLELAYKLHLAAEHAAVAAAEDGGSGGEVEQSPPIDWSNLYPGALAAVKLDQVVDYGAIMDIVGQEDLVGLVHPHQGASQPELLGDAGEQTKACVVDTDKVKGVVDLSVKPALTQLAAAAAAAAGSGKKGSKKQQQHLPVVGSDSRAVVLEIKEHYVVVGLQQQQQQQQGQAVLQEQQQNGTADKKPSTKAAKAAAATDADNAQQQQQQQYTALGFVARGDFNSQGSNAKEYLRYKHDQVLMVRVVAHPSEANGMRLLLEPCGTRVDQANKRAAGASGKTPSGPKTALVPAHVAAVHDWNLEVTFGYEGKKSARIHVAELQERLTSPPGHNPLSAFQVDQDLSAAYLGHPKTLSKRTKDLQLSLRPSALQAAKKAPADYDGKVPYIAPVLTPLDLHPHLLVVGWVTAIEQNGLWLTLAPGIQGRVHVFETSQNPEQLAVPLEDRFSLGQALQAVVKSVDLKHKQLSLSIRPDRISQGVTDPADAAAKAATAAAAEPEQPAAAAAAADGSGGKRRLPPAGQLVTGKISKIIGAGVVIELTKNLKGIVALTELHDSWVPNALAGLKPGQFVRARVLGADQDQQQQQQPLVDKHGHLMLSLKPSDGGAVAGVDGWSDAAAAAAAAEPQQKGNKKAKQQQQQQQQQGSSTFVDVESLKPGSKIQGYVRGVSDKGLFLALDRLHHGRVKKNQLSDGFIEDPAAAFPVGAMLTARVLSVQQAKPQGDGQPAAAAAAAAAAGRWSGRVLDDDGVKIELTLLSGELSGLRQISEIKEGELTQGKVSRVEPYGVFVQLHRSQVRGLVHISQVEKAYSKDLAKHYTPGQIVSVRVLSVDADARKVSLSMKADLLVGSDDEADDMDQDDLKHKPADFDDEMVDALEAVVDSEDGSGEDEESGSEEDEESAGEGEESEEEGEESSGEDEESDVDLDDMDVDDEGEDGSSESESGSSSEDESSGGEDDVMPPRGLHNLLQPELLGPSGSDWGELQLADDAAAAAADGVAGKSGLTRADKKRLKAQREAEIAAAERARLAGPGAGPESASEYEQQLLAQPNNSYLWIKYMAFQLKLGEVESARRIAERALSTITMTAERDKFNVWVALMNLEDAYGGEGSEDAVMAVFNRALQVCEQKPLYLALLGILERSGRSKLAAEVWRTATKKFNTSCKVWLGAFESALQAAQRQAAAADGEEQQAAAATANAPRQLLERALKSLPRRKHVKALTRAALAEFRLGCPEHGRSVFEGVLVNYPKRTDLWNVYLDQEVKSGDAARVRSLLARVTSLALPPKKMKGFFRRWLEYEEAHGTAADVEGVKQRAMDYMRAQETA